jgi:hypothetical protein
VLSWALNATDPVPLRCRSGQRITFRASQNFRIVQARGALGPWRVSTAAYYYSIDTEEGGEIISYHWHPEDTGGIDFPHAHLGPAAGNLHPDLASAHVRTGRVSVEYVLEMLIEDFGVRARRGDWRPTLRKAHGKFRDARSWS